MVVPEYRVRTITVAEQTKLVGKPVVPALLATLFGVGGLFVYGLSPAFALNTYVLIVGGLMSAFAIVVYMHEILAVPERSWRATFSALGGIIPYTFSIYLMGYLGIFSFWKSIRDGFTVWLLLTGIVWLLLGYRMLYTFWIITEIGEERRRIWRDISSN